MVCLNFAIDFKGDDLAQATFSDSTESFPDEELSLTIVPALVLQVLGQRATELL
jgi:hypothetical protein